MELDIRVIETVLDTVNAVREVGLKEVWLSIEPQYNSAFTSWLIDQGFAVNEAEWNYPESLYVGTDKPQRPLTVFSVKW